MALKGDAPAARQFFKETIKICPETFVEYATAKFEMMRLGG